VLSTLVETPEDCDTLQSNEDMRRGETVKTDIALGRNKKHGKSAW